MVKWIYKLADISNIKRISFRQDINGLRAIAVLAVVFYHAELELFKGGWLGVDIFFVISGYLISNIIISELNEGTFSFKNFYLRRVRRILPALFSTLLLTIPFAYYFLTPKAMEEYINSLIASVFFYANYHFMNLDFYIAESTKLMPLLHTWSLAIEEQYYLLFPLFAFIVYKYFKKHFTFFIGFITIGSLYLNTLSKSSDKFYRLEFRIWELLLGVLVMILSSNLKIKHLEKIGLPLMFFPIFYFDNNWINDSEPKLIALIGISLIIFSNTESSILSKILSYKLISIIGLSSYSIYLLHQPFFAFIKIYNEIEKEISFNAEKYIYSYSFLIFCIFLTLLFGIIQYTFVEIKLTKSLYLRNFIILALITLFLFSILGYLSNSYQNRYDNDELSSQAIDYQNLEKFDLEINNETCHIRSIDVKIEELCVSNTNKKLKKIIVIGDSHSRLFLKPFNEIFGNDYSITYATGSSCIFFTNTINTLCKRSDQEKVISLLNKSENNIIIYFADLQDKINNEENNFIVNVPLTIQELSIKNKVIVIKQIPLFPVNVANTILNNRMLNEIIFPREEWLLYENRLQVEELYNSINNENVIFIDTFEIFCNEIKLNYCVGAFQEKVYIYDDNHPSVEGSKLIISKIELILKTLNS
jgi:peptidoglycan/LPS O-acetylase OafA/YrhL